MKKQNSRIHSKNIYLEPLKEDDFDLYKEIYTSSDLMKYLGPIFSEESVRRSFNTLLKNMPKSQPKSTLYVIRQSCDDDELGVIGLNWNQNSTNIAETGIIIRKKHHKSGHGFEASIAFLEFAFNNWEIDLIVSHISEENTAVLFLTRKLGFKNAGTRANEKNKSADIILKMTLKDLLNR